MDWQSIVVGVIVAGAALYVVLHLLAALGIFQLRNRRQQAPSCAAGCGQCGGGEESKR